MLNPAVSNQGAVDRSVVGDRTVDEAVDDEPIVEVIDTKENAQ